MTVSNETRINVIDSNDFADARFVPHGRSEIAPVGPIIRIQTEGPFNFEAIVAINRTREQMGRKVAQLDRYAYLNVWRTSALMSHDALAEYQRGLQKDYGGRIKAPVAIAWVFPPEIEGGELMCRLYQRTFAEIALPFGIFATEAAALAWLADQLAPKG